MRTLGSAFLFSVLASTWACSEGESGSSGGGGSAGVAGTPSSGGSAMGGSAGSAAGTDPGGAGAGGTGMGGTGTAGSDTGGSGGEAGSANGGTGEGGMAGATAGGGGSPGGSGGDAGASGSGGSAGGGTVMPKSGMNFFVTSRGGDKGGNFGSLEAADAFCDELATAVSADLGAKTWRAYLSTSSVNARDRIGAGPWRNQAGVVVANDVTELHQQEAGQALDDTWPPADLSIALTETGQQVPNDVHDILTGTNVDGTVAMDATCNDWTSQETTDTVQVGHSNRTGGGRPPYFNATHTAGCAPSTMNRVSGTVTQGGGRGSIYCFALEPSPEP